MADGKIRIVITDETGSAKQNVETQNTPQTLQKSKLGAEKDQNIASQYVLLRSLENSAKQIVNYSLGNIGNFTGDYNTQRSINEAIGLAGKGIVLGTMIATGNFVGAVASGIGMITSDVLSYVSETKAINKQNYEISQLRKLSGLDQLTNGSR